MMFSLYFPVIFSSDALGIVDSQFSLSQTLVHAEKYCRPLHSNEAAREQ